MDKNTLPYYFQIAWFDCIVEYREDRDDYEINVRCGDNYSMRLLRPKTCTLKEIKIHTAARILKALDFCEAQVLDYSSRLMRE